MKKSLVFALALMLVVAFASSAMAAQVLQNGSYLSTTATGMTYGNTAVSGFERVYKYNKFYADGITNYPYEIYLPNEQTPANYRIHSSYAKNTDACASCHSTHTAVGNTLLQWYSVYETCMACHDGTISSTYDVQSGKIGTGKPAMGGAFGTSADQYVSKHNVTGSLSISAAPGGSTVAEPFVLGSDTKNRWTPAFGCESCHTPHANGGNARILNPDTNYTATKNKVATGYTVNADGSVHDAYGNDLYILKGYPYTIDIQNLGTTVAGAYITNVNGYSQVVIGGVVSGAAEKVYGTAGLQVKMTITNYLNGNAAGGETVSHVYGMNYFCGACHTDYNTQNTTHSSDTESGTYTQAHRHQVGVAPTYNVEAKLNAAGMVLEGGNLECLTCHVAHGVNADYWARTVGTTGTSALSYLTNGDLVELAGSSALKRLPNMGTCEACHQKGASAEGYAANAGALSAQGAGVTDYTPNTYGYDLRKAQYPIIDLGWVGSAACVPCHKDYVDGWAETTHKSSNHTGATSCGRCHNPGNSIITTGTFASGQADSGVTCEACHGTGKYHVTAPTSKNIFNPGTRNIERQAIECGKCHDMFNNIPDYPDTFGLGTVSGMSYGGVVSGSTLSPSTAKLADLVSLNGWSVAYRAYQNDPAKFADANQLNATSSHFGGAWGYADSRHFKGQGTSANPTGVVSCNTCHNMHKVGKIAGALKFDYTQVCASCHDAGANLAQAVAMPQNAWNRHQLEFRDFAHSFKFGNAANVVSAAVYPVNLEKAVDGLAGAPDTVTVPGKQQFYTVYDSIYGDYGTVGNYNLFRGATSGGGIGMKVKAYSNAGNTVRVYNNYEMTWEFVGTTATATTLTGLTFEEEVGAIEFANPVTTGSGSSDPANLASYAKYAGDYTVKYTSKANPAVTGTVTFTVVNGIKP